MNILIVSKCPTHPTTAGNRYGILAQAEKLKSMGNDVHFLFVYEPALHKNLRGDALNDIKATKEYWGDHYHQFTVGSIQKYKMIFLKYFRKYFCNMHYKVDDEYPYGVEKLVNKLDGQYHFDICIVNYYYMSRLFEYINIPKTAIFTHDCFAYKNIKIGQQVLCTTADTEAKAMQRCKHIFAVQDIEAAYFQILSPKSKVYNIYGAYSYHPQKISGNHNIVFLSGGNPYNQHGLKWFLSEVFPLIRKRFPDIRLLIGGSISNTLKGQDIANVEVQGFVDDPAIFYAQGDVCINPCYQGTGLKIKTFEAISYDKVTMVHPHSMEGIYKPDEAPIFASAEPIQWVKFLEQVWGDPIQIEKIKQQNKIYLDRMEAFVDKEYQRFLKD